ncbi:hypothetical protein K449DRAFT_400240 [Hypoxylon sp. EC38]|nr:hypothetical protein K449DRAFT_400240 [Hypoxylon sp. EC38]
MSVDVYKDKTSSTFPTGSSFVLHPIEAYLARQGPLNGELLVNIQNFQEFSISENASISVMGNDTLYNDLSEKLQALCRLHIPHRLRFTIGVGRQAPVGGVGTASQSASLAT